MANDPQNQDAVQQTNNSGTPLQGDKLSKVSKVFAGILLIGLTVFSALYIIGHWPNKLPRPEENIDPLYSYEWFHVLLIENIEPQKQTIENISNVDEVPIVIADSIKNDTLPSTNANTNTIKENNSKPKNENYIAKAEDKSCLLHINTILLILVACGGFLGNMIYVATSFTTYLGANTLKKSWLLWYFVKPFTASALAITIYFVFRGGFLNMSDDSSSINLYGVMTISILSGLFTDRTTLKLKEVFDVLLKPKEERSDPLEGNAPKIETVTADLLEPGKEATITITGTKLNNGSISIQVNGDEITSTSIKPEEIKFTYKVPDDYGEDEIKVVIKPDAQSKAQEYKLKIKKA